MKFALALALTVLLAPVAAAAAAQPTAPVVQRVVLPVDVRPDRYELRIEPDAEHLTFRGRATISLHVLVPTARIVLNAAGLAFQKAEITGTASAPRIEVDDAAQTASFIFDQQLAPGPYQLTIDYTGRIFQQASGLFALDSVGPNGRERALFTQFENSDARRFAPLWDEPAIKAVFSLSVAAPAGRMVISNMPVAWTGPLADGRVAVTFADTPKMSSYLLFMAMGDFERVHRKVGPTDVGVVVRRGDAASAGFALDTAAQILPYYNDWFGTPYPLPKLDIVAGAGQSQFFGAMENWGAIFAFDHDVLLDARASQADQQNVYTAIAHEMAHQWFGDLVTMAWWDDLWLNEGFASWMQNKAADRFHPEWKSTLQSMAGLERAMQVDAAPGTHPVVTPIRDVFAASGAFDIITYQKGQAVVRMLEQYVGEDAFRDGIRAYIAHYAYGNTRTDDLWAELEKVSPKPVTAIAHDFTLQSGVPMIRVEDRRDGVRLSQEQFAFQRRVARTWQVPVQAAPTASGAWSGLVSRRTPQNLSPSPDAPLVVNAGHTGYFRTRYAPKLWSALTARFATLAPADQLGLLYDSRALGQAGTVSLGDFLGLARPAAAAQEPIVATALVDELLAIGRTYPSSQPSPAFAAFARARLQPILARVGWQPQAGEAASTSALRAEVIAGLGEFDDAAVIAEARVRFESGASETASPELRYALQDVVAKHARPADWAALHKLAQAAASTRERERLYRLLGAAGEPALVDAGLALAISGEPQPTTAPAIIATVSTRYPEKAFDFALAHRELMDTLLEPPSRTIYYADLASGSRDVTLIPRLKAFGATVPESTRGEIDKAIGGIERRKLFIERRLPEIERWLAANPEALAAGASPS